ncbi:MAG: PAS domain S-box protein [Candidatus Acidiferrum sp.]
MTANNKVLLAEQVSTVSTDLAARLLRLGYTVSATATSSKQAIEFAESLSPDLVLMDIHLSGEKDGVAAASEIRRRFQIPVVFLTATADENALEQGKSAEPYGYVLQSSDDRELRTNIEVALFRNKSESQISRMSGLFSTLSRVNQAIVRSRSLDELLQSICQVTLESGQFKSAWIGRLNSPTGDLTPVAKVGDDPAIVLGQPVHHCGCALEAVKTEKLCFIDDVDHDALAAACHDNGPLLSCVSVPIRLQNRLWGVLVAGTASKDFFHGAERQLLEEMAMDISFAMEMFEVERRRKEAEAALIERERRLETILRTSLDAFWIVDLAGNFLEVNDAFCEMSGYPRDELLLLNIAHIKGNPYEDDALDLVLQNARAGASRIESRLCRKDGAIIDIEASVNFHDFDSGRFVFFLRDVTARKRAELQLRQSEERFSKAFRGSPLAISISSLSDGRILDVNDALLQMFHLQRKDIIGFTHSQIALWVESAQRVMMFKKLQDSGRATSFRAQLKTARGEIFEAEVSSELIDVGGIRCVLSVVVDVTEAQRMEARLRQAHKMEAVGNLAGGVAHDFNNLLGVIMGYCDISASLVGPESALSRNLAEIKNAAQQATVLTHQLLTFGRRQIVFPKILDLNEVVQHAMNLLNRSVPQNVHILFHPTRSLGSIKVDPIQVEQVLTSLVENAREAMPQGGRISLETSSVELDEHAAAQFHDCQPGSYIALTVADTGSGMDETTRSRIFEPFFTTKESGRSSGLGLSTVYGIVQQSGGHIQVHSEPGKGTTFTVYFPKVVEAGRRIETRVNDSPAAQGSATILLVESDKPLRELACTLLQAAGYLVVEAQDAQAALDILHSSTPVDLLFTDVIMPGKSGPELAAEARLLRPNLPLLFMSGYSGNLITAGSAPLPESNFLQKPFTRQALLTRIQSILSQ